MVAPNERPLLPIDADDPATLENAQGLAPEDLPTVLDDEGDEPGTADDPYQDSDEALPSDDEERAIDENFDGESGRFGE
jgi:hypothetical protein